MRLEPVAVVNGLIAIIEASIALAVGFGLNWSGEQVGLVMAVVIAVGNFAKTLWARGQVTPVDDPRNNEGRRLTPEQQSDKALFNVAKAGA
jgi:hypothetical protein